MDVELAPDARLGRAVYSESRAKRARAGKIDMDIFLETEKAESLSVDRMECASHSELAKVASKRGRSRKPPRPFYGWADLTVRHAMMSGRTAKATPISDNRCHADIFLEVTGDERRRQQKTHANELSAHSSWVESPLTARS